MRREFLKEGLLLPNFSVKNYWEDQGRKKTSCYILDWRTFLEKNLVRLFLILERVLEGKSDAAASLIEEHSRKKNLVILFLLWNEFLGGKTWFCWSLWWRWSSKRILEEDMNYVVERKFGENSWRRPEAAASLNEVRGRKPCCCLVKENPSDSPAAAPLLHSWLKIILEGKICCIQCSGSWYLEDWNWGTL